MQRTLDGPDASRYPRTSIHLIVLAAYLAVALASVVLLDSASPEPGSSPAAGWWEAVILRVAPVLAASVAAGWLIGSWWSLSLALAPAAIAPLFGYADALGEDVSVWFIELLFAPAYALMLGIGVILGARARRSLPRS